MYARYVEQMNLEPIMTEQKQEEVKLKNLVRATDLLKEFEENYLRKMYLSADSLWDKYGGVFPTPEIQSRYEELRAKSLFLKEFYEAMELSINYVAVTAHSVDKLVTQSKELRLIHNGKIRERLFTEQQEFLTTMLDKLEKINSSYLER
jgi:hypothetical protein